MSTILVLSPHPDDEAIGCGGSIVEHVRNGDRVFVDFLTSGEQGGHGVPPEEAGPIREAEARAAASVLGVTGVEFWRLPDGGLDVTADDIDRLCRRLEDVGPETVYVTHPAEMHPDHRAAARMLAGATERLASPSYRILSYEVWTPLQTMDHIVDISASIDTKLEAIRCYESQCRVLRFDDAARGLARYRGEMHSWPGGDYAEIFVDGSG